MSCLLLRMQPRASCTPQNFLIHVFLLSSSMSHDIRSQGEKSTEGKHAYVPPALLPELDVACWACVMICVLCSSSCWKGRDVQLTCRGHNSPIRYTTLFLHCYQIFCQASSQGIAMGRSAMLSQRDAVTWAYNDNSTLHSRIPGKPHVPASPPIISRRNAAFRLVPKTTGPNGCAHRRHGRQH